MSSLLNVESGDLPGLTLHPRPELLYPQPASHSRPLCALVTCKHFAKLSTYVREIKQCMPDFRPRQGDTDAWYNPRKQKSELWPTAPQHNHLVSSRSQNSHTNTRRSQLAWLSRLECSVRLYVRGWQVSVGGGVGMFTVKKNAIVSSTVMIMSPACYWCCDAKEASTHSSAASGDSLKPFCPYTLEPTDRR